MKKIIITGGGSGGHTMPAVAFIETLKKYSEKNGIDFDILYVGSKKGIEKQIAEKNKIKFKSISTGKLRRYISIENMIDIFKVAKGIIDSYFVIAKYRPDIIFSTGGFVSVPVVIAAKMRGVKVIVHEQTVDAGLANKIAGKFADKIALTFEESKKYFVPSKTVVTGIPLRDSIFSGTKESGYKRFGFDSSLPVIYISGGGLGCHLLNKTMLEITEELLGKANIIIQTGNAAEGKDYQDLVDFKETLKNETLKKRLAVFNFINEELGDIFAIADLAVARSGAGTVNELIALKIPAIFIPLAIATNDEQYKNAMIMKSKNTAEIIRESELDKEKLLSSILEILTTDKIKIMKNNFNSFGDFKGNEKLLSVFMDMIK